VLDKLALRFIYGSRYLCTVYKSALANMPLDTSTTYPLTRLRLDGRRWNELRLLQAQISTNPASSGSSYLSMGNTAIMCSVHGPAEGRRGEASGAAGSAGAIVEVDVNVAGFASVDRRRKAGGSDK
jgi:exosome complex component RRP41